MIDQIKRARATIRLKSQFYYNRIIVIRFVYRLKGYIPKVVKVSKILNQEYYKDIIKAKAFLRIYI